jgi:hypothetical protein
MRATRLIQKKDKGIGRWGGRDMGRKKKRKAGGI